MAHNRSDIPAVVVAIRTAVAEQLEGVAIEVRNDGTLFTVKGTWDDGQSAYHTANINGLINREVVERFAGEAAEKMVKKRRQFQEQLAAQRRAGNS